MTTASALDPVAELAARQSGLLSRRQLRRLGVPRTVVRSHLRGRRWQRVHPGVYAVYTGPLPPLARVWAGLLYAGEVAAVSHDTAAWLWGLRDDLPAVVEVVVPHGRRHRGSRPGVRVRQSRHLGSRRHPVASPPRIRLEDTVLDLTDRSHHPDVVIDVVLRACQQRLTTPVRLAVSARDRKRLRWRRLVADLLADVRDGVTSTIERRFARDVERAHGLPRGSRNVRDGSPGRRSYRDVRYRAWKVVVELDGRAAHPQDERERDDLRDNELVEDEGAVTLRYGWRSTTGAPCRTATQVARVLRARGWAGTPRRCGADCELAWP